MKIEQLNRLLNTACEIITELEHNADEEQKKKINSMFNEIKYAEKIDEEMSTRADEEAQDFGTFGENKI